MGFACGGFSSFKLFYHLALSQQVLDAMVFISCGPCGHVLYFASGLTRRSSRPAYCGRLILSVRQFSLYSRQMRNFVLIASAALLLSACASPARYAWVKEGASDHQRTNDTSECTYQVRLNKTPAAEQKELHSLCMQGKGYRLKRVG